MELLSLNEVSRKKDYRGFDAHQDHPGQQTSTRSTSKLCDGLFGTRDEATESVQASDTQEKSE